jgi:hypothetical protein
VPAEPDWSFDYSGVTTGDLIGLSNERLAAVDPLAMNLIVAREISSLTTLDLANYQNIVNDWALTFAGQYLPYWTQSFQGDPTCFRNDYRFFAVGMICQYLREEVGVAYKEDQREITAIRYTNPSDLFVKGVIDSLRGTCATIPALALAIA